MNPDFAPDEDCVYDVSQIHCIPGSAQECPRPQFNEGDPSMCSPRTLVDGEWRWICPDGYHEERVNAIQMMKGVKMMVSY